MKVSELKREMTEMFAQVDARLGRVEASLVSMERKIAEEGQVIRRHFDIVAEQFKTEVQLTLDRSMATAGQVATFGAVNAAEHAGFTRMLDNHEVRLTALGPPRDS